MISFIAVLALFLLVSIEIVRKYNAGNLSPPRSLFRNLALGAVFYTNLTGLGVTNLMTTFTHSLGITPSLLVARPILHQVAVTVTAPLIVGTIGTNIITVAAGVGTLATFDLEVQQIHSLIS